MRKLIVIVGPTSSGKTSLAISLCKKFNGEIVSADSRQIYKYMDIGTNKGRLEMQKRDYGAVWELEGVPIWGVNLVVPNETLTVVQYSDYAKKRIKEIWRRQHVPFIVGGTGFYIDVVLGKQEVGRIPPNPALRKQLEDLGVKELYQRLQKLDPGRAVVIDKKNPRRLIRAIEIATAGGSVIKKEQGFSRHFEESVDTLIIGLTAPREVLYARADAWVEEIFIKGVEGEVKSLLAKGYRKSPAMQGIIYKTVVDLVDGRISPEQAKQTIKFDLHAFIRRQLTWFKRDKRINWFDITEPNFDKDVELLVQAFIGG